MNGATEQPMWMLLTTAFSNWIIPFVILAIVAYGYARKVKVYEVFVEGAKEGFTTGVMIIPYLVVILMAIAVFRTSGCMDFLAYNVIGRIVPDTIFPPDAVIMSLLKPLSGSGARGIMVEIFQRYGPDSFQGFMASTIQGSTETTFYVIAVYYGAIGVKRMRHTVGVGLLAEVVAVVCSVVLTNIWFHFMK